MAEPKQSKRLSSNHNAAVSAFKEVMGRDPHPHEKRSIASLRKAIDGALRGRIHAHNNLNRGLTRNPKLDVGLEHSGRLAQQRHSEGLRKFDRAASPPTKREAAIKAYTEKFGREPPKRMSVKAMTSSMSVKKMTAATQNPGRAVTADIAPTPKTKGLPVQERAQQLSSVIHKRYHRGQMSLDHASKLKSAAFRAADKVTGPITISGQPRSVGVTNDMAMGTTPPAPKGPGIASRAASGVVNNWGKINVGLALTAGAVGAARQYSKSREKGMSRGEAATRAAMEASVPVGLAAAPAISRAGHAVGRAGFGVAGAMVDTFGLGVAFIPGLNVGTGAAASIGIAGHTVGAVAKVAGRIAAPALAVANAAFGYKRDGVRGAVRGALTAFDPTELATLGGAKSGAVGWAFDKAFGAGPSSSSGATRPGGSASRAAVSAPDAGRFSQANVGFAKHTSVNNDGTGQAVAGRSSSGAGAPGYIDQWTDSLGRNYQRQDMSVRTAKRG